MIRVAGVVLHRGMGRSGGGSGGDAQGPAGERDSWTQQPFCAQPCPPALALSTPRHSPCAIPLLPAPPALAPPFGRVLFCPLADSLHVCADSPGVGAFGEADDDDAEPPPLDLSAPPPPGAPDRSGYEYDRRYDGGLGEAAKVRALPFAHLHKLLAVGLPTADFVVGSASQDEQARQWDGRYDGLSIGTTIGGEDQ
eukprot:COSAG04_NODE_932_length_9350_cov_665.689007_2_plen_196_part_00